MISAASLLAELAAGTDVVLLDVRRDDSAAARAVYQAGHLPGAYFVTLTAQLAGPRSALSGTNPLPADSAIQADVRRWGINPGSLVVVYSAESPAIATRGWWVLRWAGVPDVRYLDGGVDAWVAAGGSVSTDEPAEGSGTFTVSDRVAAYPGRGRRGQARQDRAAAGRARAGRLCGRRARHGPHPGRAQRAGNRQRQRGRPAQGAGGAAGPLRCAGRGRKAGGRRLLRRRRRGHSRHPRPDPARRARRAVSGILVGMERGPRAPGRHRRPAGVASRQAAPSSPRTPSQVAARQPGAARRLGRRSDDRRTRNGSTKPPTSSRSSAGSGLLGRRRGDQGRRHRPVRRPGQAALYRLPRPVVQRPRAVHHPAAAAGAAAGHRACARDDPVPVRRPGRRRGLRDAARLRARARDRVPRSAPSRRRPGAARKPCISSATSSCSSGSTPVKPPRNARPGSTPSAGAAYSSDAAIFTNPCANLADNWNVPVWAPSARPRAAP